MEGDTLPCFHLYTETILSLSSKHLPVISESPIISDKDLSIKDISGFSNITYMVNRKTDPLNKIVIRFFKSKVSDF